MGKIVHMFTILAGTSMSVNTAYTPAALSNFVGSGLYLFVEFGVATLTPASQKLYAILSYRDGGSRQDGITNLSTLGFVGNGFYGNLYITITPGSNLNTGGTLNFLAESTLTTTLDAQYALIQIAGWF